MQAIDRNFSPGSFLDGAEKAFHIILRAFAAGDRAALDQVNRWIADPDMQRYNVALESLHERLTSWVLATFAPHRPFNLLQLP